MSVTYTFDQTPVFTPEELEVDPNGWLSGKDLLVIIQEYAKGKDKLVGLEIGVEEGPTTTWFLQNLPNLELYGVDPYVAYQDWYPGGYLHQDERNRVKAKMKLRTAKYADRFTHYEMTSDEAVSKFEDASLDFIFIDGLHEYGQVLTDCRNYWPKMKQGAIFAGHDYKVIEGVGRAVNEFAAEIGQVQVNYLPNTDVWYWTKF